MSKFTTYFLIVFLGLVPLKMASSSASNIPIGITPSEYETIRFSSCSSEIATLPNGGLDLWKELTQLVFAKVSSSSSPHPFIVCNRIPNLSGYKRRKEIESVLDGAILSEMPMYNGNDMTCYLIQASGEVIRGIGGTNEIYIHPLLPIMKPSKGIVEDCKDNFGDGQIAASAPARINAMLFPGVSSADEFGTAILEKMKGAVMGVVLRDTFPLSGPAILDGLEEEKLEDSFFQRVRFSLGYKGESITFHIDRSTPGVSSSKILAFLAGLASQPEVVAVEVQGEIHLQG